MNERIVVGRTFPVERYWPGVTLAAFHDHVAVVAQIGRGQLAHDPVRIRDGLV